MIELEYKKQRLTINKLGAGIARYFLIDGDKEIDLIYGYDNQQEKDGSMGDVLSPFPGRVDKACYQYQNKRYKLSGLRLKDGNAIHGFVKDREWSFVEEKNCITASYLLSGVKDNQGYPFKLEHKINYCLIDKGLKVEIKVKNVGLETAPFGLGFHPYFNLDCLVDEIICQFKAGKLVEFDQELKPTGRLINIKKTNFDFSKSKKIEDLVIDHCFTDLARDKDGLFKIKLSNPKQKRSITIWQDSSFDYLQLYSADTKDKPLKRSALAVEPQTCTGYAFGMPKMGLIDLEPSQEFTANWGLELN